MEAARSLDLHVLNDFVSATSKFLISHLARNGNDLGWHNFFVPGRIGTAGSAVPLLYLHEAEEAFTDRPLVIEHLRASQFQTDRGAGGWSILSAQEVASLEGTTWPLIAIAKLGDAGDRPALLAAEKWLLDQQSPNGGWGSNLETPPRTILTANGIAALCSLTAPNLAALQRGVEWFKRSQRADGSWGLTPGDDGTVFHTAIAIQALLNAGILSQDPTIKKAANFLDSRWTNQGCWLNETYEINIGNQKYSRITLEHNVDAAVLDVALRVLPISTLRRVAEALHKMTEEFALTGNCPTPERKPSIWNIVPPALAAQRFLKTIPAQRAGKLFCVRNSIIITQDHSHWTTEVLGEALAWIKRAMYDKLLYVLAAIITLLIITLLLVGKILWPEFLLSFILPLILFFLQLRWDRNHDR